RVGAAVLHAAPATAAVLALVKEEERATATRLDALERSAGQQLDRRVDHRSDRSVQASIAGPAPGERPVGRSERGSCERLGLRLSNRADRPRGWLAPVGNGTKHAIELVAEGDGAPEGCPRGRVIAARAPTERRRVGGGHP